MIVPGWKWESFKPEEVLSPDGLAQLGRGVLLIQISLLDKLELFRTFLGFPLLVNHAGLKYRGYRSPKENYEIVKGEEYSFHMQGLAADLSCNACDISHLHDMALKFGWHGVGFYPKNGFVHVDLRPRLSNVVARWQK